MSAAEKIRAEQEERKMTPRNHLSIVGLETGEHFSVRDAISFILWAPKKQLDKEEKMGEDEKKESVVRRKREKIRYLKENRDVLLNLFGVEKISDVEQLVLQFNQASRGANRERENEIKDQIRARLIEYATFLDSEKDDENKVNKMRILARGADDYINAKVQRHFPNNDRFKMNNEVALCDDAAKLLIMAFNPEYTAKIRFEAARKLFLMKALGEMQSFKEEGLTHVGAADEMMTFIDRRMVNRPEGHKIGDLITRYLFHKHEPTEFRAIEAKFITQQEAANIKLKKGEKIMEFSSRRDLVEMLDGNQKYINYRVHARPKSEESRLDKMLRENGAVGEQDVDLNGFEMVFDTREEWEAYFKKYLKNIQADILENLEIRKQKVQGEEKKAVEERITSLKNSKFVKVYQKGKKIKNSDEYEPDKLVGMYLSKDPNAPEIDRKSKEEAKEFFEALKVKGGSKEAKEKLKKELENIDTTVVIYDLKDSMGGGKFEGKSEGSSEDNNVFKFKMELQHSDDKRHHYEVQAFTPLEYINSKTRNEVSWPEYSVKRFFDSGLGDLLFPPKRYPSDRKKDREKSIKRVRREVQNGNGNDDITTIAEVFTAFGKATKDLVRILKDSKLNPKSWFKRRAA